MKKNKILYISPDAITIEFKQLAVSTNIVLKCKDALTEEALTNAAQHNGFGDSELYIEHLDVLVKKHLEEDHAFTWGGYEPDPTCTLCDEEIKEIMLAFILINLNSSISEGM